MNAPNFIVAPSTFKPRFRRREYPALKVLMIVLYACAGLTFLSFLLCLGLLFTGTAAVFSADAEAGGMTGLLGLFVAVAVGIVHAAVIVGFMLPAELIKVLLDIQWNTQEAAWAGR